MIEVTTRSIVEQLCDIYINHENWHHHKLSLEESRDYFHQMIEKGAIEVYEELGVVLGYVEVYLLNYEQWGRIVCRQPFDSRKENITDGNIAYVSNCFILPQFRNSSVVKTLKIMFFKKCFKADYFVGIALRKSSSQPIKVFKRDELCGKLFKTGEP